MKKFIPLLLIFTIVTFLFYACQNQDVLNDIDRQQQSGLTFEQISFDQFIQSEAPETLISLESYLDIKKQLKSSSGENDEKFTIRTDGIKKIVKDGYASFTFMIEDNDKEDDTFENLAILKLDTVYKYYRIKYTREKETSEIPYAAAIKEVPEDALDLDTFSEFLKGGANDCPRISYSRCSVGGSADGHQPVLQWNGKYCSGSPTTYDFNGCDWDGGGNDSEEDAPYTTEGGNSNEGGVSGPGGGEPSPPGGPTTSPTDPGLEDTSEMDEFNRNKVRALGIRFSSAQVDFLVRYPYLINVIQNFIDQDNSQEAEDFAIAAVDAWMNNGEVNFDDQIINNLTDKAKCIYDKLNISSSDFKNAIQKFDGEFPVSHLTFIINNSLPTGNYGRTIAPDNYNITIEMSNTQLGTISDLGGAVSFAHEMIHAEIFRKMLSAAQTGNLDPDNMTQEQQVNYVESLRDNFPGLYDYYYIRHHPTWNHNLMAQHYRSTIADIAQEFDNSNLSRQIYEDIAWAGLRVLENMNNSIAWDNLSSTEQQRISNNLSNTFVNGSSNCN